MKLILDENLPKKLKQDLLEYEVYTVYEKGWSGLTNGKLLEKLIEEGFDALITFDKNLQFQQNFNKYTIGVIILDAEDNTHQTLSNLTSEINQLLKNGLKIGPNIISHKK